MRSANFEKAWLHGADCSGARLDRSIFTRAYCADAVFTGAWIPYADFSHADLSGADLSGAKLFRAKLHGIQDEGALFTDRKSALGDDPELAEAENWRPVH